MIYGETGTTPLHITIEKRMIGYWLQILMGSSSKINYQIYKYIYTYDTKCKICDKNEIHVGDEFHYLFICRVFQEDRNRLLKEYYRKFPSMYKFIELMSTTNMKDLRKLAEFATIIIRKFQ